VTKRYCISPVVGTGTDTNPFRAAVGDVAGVNHQALIPTKPDGAPKYLFALCVVATGNLAAVLQVSNLFALPDYALDGQMGGMEIIARTGMVQSVEAYNLDGQGMHLSADHDDSDSYRDVLTSLGRQIVPGFSLNNFDALEP
jgi:hypothetical protein